MFNAHACAVLTRTYACAHTSVLIAQRRKHRKYYLFSSRYPTIIDVSPASNMASNLLLRIFFFYKWSWMIYTFRPGRVCVLPAPAPRNDRKVRSGVLLLVVYLGISSLLVFLRLHFNVFRAGNAPVSNILMHFCIKVTLSKKKKSK